MKLRLSSELIEKIPGITVGALVIKNIRNQKKSSSVTQLLRGVCAQRKVQWKNEEKKKEIASLLNCGHVGEKTLPEVQLLESRLRRVGNNREIGHTNNLQGILNYLALKNLVSVFGYDLDDVEKDIEVRLIKPKQGKHPDDYTFLPETNHIIVYLIDIGASDKEKFTKYPSEFSKTIQKYCFGNEDNLFILNADQPEVDLNYVSEKEKAYAQEQQLKAESKKSIEENGFDASLPNFLAEPSAQIKPEPLLKDQIRELIKRSTHEYLNAQKAFNEDLLDLIDVHRPNEASHGDYASGIAMKLAKTLEKNPQEIAESIIQLIPKNDIIDKAETAGPGFININVSDKYLIAGLDKIMSYKENYGRLTLGADKKIAVEYSAPNIAKPLGVHHLLSTLIGQTVANILRFSGYRVTALNYPGDWGTQFGKLIYAYKTWGDEAVVNKDPLNELLKLYVRFHDEAEKTPELEDKGREEFRKLEEGDDENLKLWQWMKDLSIREMERIYKKLGVSFDEYLGEYMYLNAAKDLIKEGLDKGIVTEGEKGALVVKFEEDKYPPYILQKGDGTTIYASRDLASIKDRIERLKVQTLVYVVDVAQSLHFKQLFETARKYGFNADFHHVIFGRMQLPEGKMSTRKGEVILVDELIKEATTRTQKLVDEKSLELTPQERSRIAELMAVSAIKYQIIAQNRETNITFQWDKMISLDGNSAPYLQYTLARAQSILRKNAEQIQKIENEKAAAKNNFQTDLFTLTESKILEESVNLASKKVAAEAHPDENKLAEPAESLEPFAHPSEKNLLHLFPGFPEAVSSAALEYKPNLLANYLYNLAKAFNAFYDQVSVLSAKNEQLKQSRIKLVQVTAQILKNGLNVLGVAVFERM